MRLLIPDLFLLRVTLERLLKSKGRVEEYWCSAWNSTSYSPVASITVPRQHVAQSSSWKPIFSHPSKRGLEFSVMGE